jgi:hypothetical protein
MGRRPVPVVGVGVAGAGALVTTGTGESATAGGEVTPGGLSLGVATGVIGPPDELPAPISTPQQKFGDGSGVGVLVPTGGNVPLEGVVAGVGDAATVGAAAEPATEPAPERAELAWADGPLAGAGWFGGTETGPGSNGSNGRGLHVGEGVGVGDRLGVGVGVGVAVAATWAITRPEG